MEGDRTKKNIAKQYYFYKCTHPDWSFCDSHTGTARGLAFLDRRPCPFRVKPISNQILSTKTKNVRWKSLTVICKQFKRAEQMSFYAFILRDKRIKLKRKNKQQHPSTNSLRRPRGIPQNTRDRSATKNKTTSYGNYYSKKNQQKKKREKKKNKTRIKTTVGSKSFYYKKTTEKSTKNIQPFQQEEEFGKKAKQEDQEC